MQEARIQEMRDLLCCRFVSSSPLNQSSANEMADSIRNRKISPVQLVQTHLALIEELNPKINAFIHVDAERALYQARAAEATVMRNENLGPLHGVPISIKSSISVAGMPFETGTRLRKG